MVAAMSWPAILLWYSLLSLSLPYAGFCGEEPIITGPNAGPLFRDEGVFSSQHIAIGKILEHPEAYDLRIVLLKGTVTKVDRPRSSDDPDGSLSSAYGALGCNGRFKPLYTFTLEDETGSLKVGVFSSLSCYPLQIAVAVGDRIIAEVKIVISNMDTAGQNHRTIAVRFGRGKRITE